MRGLSSRGSRAAVPNLSGIRDGFHGRQLFRECREVGLVEAVLRGMRSDGRRSPPVCDLVPSRLWTATGPRPGVGGPCSRAFRL